MVDAQSRVDGCAAGLAEVRADEPGRSADTIPTSGAVTTSSIAAARASFQARLRSSQMS